MLGKSLGHPGGADSKPTDGFAGALAQHQRMKNVEKGGSSARVGKEEGSWSLWVLQIS